MQEEAKGGGGSGGGADLFVGGGVLHDLFKSGACSLVINGGELRLLGK